MNTMRKYWFHRLLASYVPIFLVIVSILIFIFFTVLSDQVKRQAVAANLAAAEQGLQSVDYSLQSIHEMVMKEIRNNEYLQQFFNARPPSEPFVNAKASDLINSMAASNRLIHSVYLYRSADRKVISTRMTYDFEQFGDRNFAVQAFDDRKLSNWTGIRDYVEDMYQPKPIPVVSLVRRYPVLQGDSGIIVINLDPVALQKTLDGMTNAKTRFFDLYDGQGRIFFDKRQQFAGVRDVDPAAFDYKVASVAKSDLTGWELRSGFKNDTFYNAASVMDNIWAWLGMLAIALGVTTIVYLSRRNYKPIEWLLQRIHANAGAPGSSAPAAKRDEFAVIAAAIDDLVEQSDLYRRRQDEDLRYRKQYFFQELLEGTRLIDETEWEREMGRFGLPGKYGSLVVAAVEIDRFADFANVYSPRDQLLLKYVVSSVVREIAESARMPQWSEWMSNRYLAVLFLPDDDRPDAAVKVGDICERVRIWISANLTFTATFGIGKMVLHPNQIGISFEEALSALKYKPVLGSDKVISASAFSLQAQSGLYPLLQSVRGMAQSFRLLDGQWREEFARFFDELRDGLFSRDDIVHLLTYMYFHLEREMMELPPEFQSVWKEEAQSLLMDRINRFELLEDIRDDFDRTLAALSDRLQGLRQRRQHHSLVREIRAYLETNYANADLSLDFISQKFDLNPKYFSRLFKEELGENFTDFLTNVRVREAKRLLLETDEPVQTIAAKVGYVHTLSFIRMFKKMTGMTPGYFRTGPGPKQTEN